MKQAFRFASLFLVVLAPAGVCQPSRSFTVSVTGEGSPMILIPGLECPSDVWDHIIVHYKSTYQVHALTLAGFAGQPAVPGVRLSTVKTDIIRYIRDNRLEHPVIAGHSLGGFLALWIAATAPDLADRVVSVDGVPFLPALFDPSAKPEASAADAEQIRAMYASLSPTQLEAMTKMSLTHMISASKDMEVVLKWAAQSDGAFVGQAVYDLMTTDLRPEMAKVRAPVLLIGAGKPFAANPERLAEIRAAYEKQVEGVPDRKVALATNALHFIMLDDPEFLLRTMDNFLAIRGEQHAR